MKTLAPFAGGSYVDPSRINLFSGLSRVTEKMSSDAVIRSVSMSEARLDFAIMEDERQSGCDASRRSGKAMTYNFGFSGSQPPLQHAVNAMPPGFLILVHEAIESEDPVLATRGDSVQDVQGQMRTRACDHCDLRRSVLLWAWKSIVSARSKRHIP